MDAHKNFAYSLVATAPSPASSGTSLIVTAADGTKFPAVPFNVTIWPTGVNPTVANAEIVRVTAISTDTLTITRAQEGTSARTVIVGDQIAATITALTITDIEAAVTLARMADLAQDQFIGRTTASTGVPETATITAAARTVLDDTSVAAMVDTLGGTAATGSGAIVRANTPVLVSPALGTPFSGVMTNVTGLPVASGISGLGTGVATFLATPSSANLISAVTDETGSGALVFSNTPTLITPLLGTPTSGVLTNCTGLPTAGLVDAAVTPTKMSTAAKTSVIGIVIDGGGSAITTGIKGDIKVPFGCTITGAQLLADQSGSIVIDVWKDTLANYPPTVGDSIAASAKPTLSSATNSNDTTLTGWTTTITAGDTIRFNVDSITTITRVVLQLTVTRS